MVCVGLLTTIRISGTAVLRGWIVVDAGLASGTTGLELVGAPGDFGLGLGARCGGAWGFGFNSGLGVAALGVWDSELVVAVLGVWRLGAGCGGAWSLETRSRSGRLQEKQAPLPEQQRSASWMYPPPLYGPQPP